MKKVRECFHVLIAAVICLMVSLVPGKGAVSAVMEETITPEILSTGEGQVADRFAQRLMDKMRCLWISSYLKRNCMWKKLFFWLHGPGDRKAASLFSNKKAAFGNG